MVKIFLTVLKSGIYYMPYQTVGENPFTDGSGLAWTSLKLQYVNFCAHG